MKKIINGKRYHTANAELLAQYSFGNPSDFRYVCESLYRTPKEAYFLHAEGGGLSDYRVSVGTNSWRGGETILPVTKEAARVWLEKRGQTQVLEKYFAADIADA